MRLALSRDGESFGEPVKIPTPKDDFAEGVRCFVEKARELAGGEKIQVVAGGIAGPLDREKSMLVNAPNIGGWNNKPLKEELEKSLSCEVYLENDTAVVGIGEAYAGAGRGVDILAYITVSTGVGGVRIVGGEVDRNFLGFEIGHHIIDLSKTENLAHPERGTVENLISGTAFERIYSKKPIDVGEDEAWERAARELAVALNNVAVFWSPEVIVLGGSMIVGDPAIHIDRVQHYFDNVLRIFPQKPEIRKAELGDVGGLHGALALLRGKKI